MFLVPGILNTSHRNKLSRCWLAGTVSEKVFKRKIANHQITEYEITEYCQEILRVFNDKRERNRWLFSLHLFSHLMFGVVKLHSYQCVLFENSVFSLAVKLDAVDCGIVAQITERREKTRGEQLAKISQIPIDELLMPLTPELHLNRPFRRDMNLLYEISPASHRRMTELDKSNLVHFSPLTESQAKLWLSNDEGCLWTNIDTCQFPDSERQPGVDEFIRLAAMEAARPDLPSRVLRTPTKRRSAQKDVGTPSKRQRESRMPQIDTLDKERTESAAAVVPMEQDGEALPFPVEPLPLPVEPMVTEAPVDPVPAIFATEQDAELHPLPEHQVAHVDAVPAIWMEQDVEPHPLTEHPAPVPTVEQVENATAVATAVQSVTRRLGYRGKKGKIVDAIKTISKVKLKQRLSNVQVFTETSWTTRSVPTQKLVRTVLQLPSAIFIFGVENIRHNRLRKISDVMLRRHEINICWSFDVEIDASYFRPRDLPRRRTDDALTVLGNISDTRKSTENGTVIQPAEVNIPPPDEVSQAEAMDEPAFDLAGEAQFPLADIEQTEHPENTSDTITASLKKVKISTDSARSKITNRRSLSSCSDWSMYSPRSKDQVRVEKSSRSKSRSSEEFIRDNESELSSPRSCMAANTVWTRKDLEANLEVFWHDNNIISFEQLAPPNETSDVDAIVCLMLLLDMHKENKVILTQARMDAPIYIEKGVISDVMDWS